MFERILLATDGSDHAIKALCVASDLAVRHDGELLLMHVATASDESEGAAELARIEGLVEERPAAPGFSSLVAPGLGEVPPVPLATADRGDLRRAVGQHILDLAARQASEAGVPRVRTILEFGDTSRQILDVVQREGADTVVLGDSGHSRLHDLFVGSLARDVAKDRRVTCITVK
jgi:nucleotide-binding universal stress UspA family protein